MRGEEVTVRLKVKDGQDALNNAVWKDQDVTVSNVLVAPGTSGNINDSTRPDGVQIKYTLYFPKTFDMRIDNAQVKVRDEWLYVVGAPRHYDKVNCPTKWWMVAEVGGSHG